MKTVIKTTDAPAAIGPYSQGILIDGTLYSSGQIGLVPATGEFVAEDVIAQAKQAFANLQAILTAADMTTNDVVKVTVLLADMGDFATVNEAYATFFAGVDALPARSAFEVAQLPKGAKVEIELVAQKAE